MNKPILIDKLIQKTKPGVSIQFETDHYILSINGEKLKLSSVNGDVRAHYWVKFDDPKNKETDKYVWANASKTDMDKFLR